MVYIYEGQDSGEMVVFCTDPTPGFSHTQMAQRKLPQAKLFTFNLSDHDVRSYVQGLLDWDRKCITLN